MSAKFSVVALGSGGMRRTVAYYDSFATAFHEMDEMTLRGASVGFHVRYDLLYDDSPFFWTLADAKEPADVCALLDAWDMFDGELTQEEKLRSTEDAMKAGAVYADGEVVAVLPG